MKAKPQPPVNPLRDASHLAVDRSGRTNRSTHNVALAFRAFCVVQSIAVCVASVPQEWRGEVHRTRTLAENDVPRAYEQAQRLQAALPPDALPADRVALVGGLNRPDLLGEALLRSAMMYRRTGQIGDLSRRNEQQIAELRQRQMQQRWLWTMLGGSVAALAVVAFFLRRQHRSHRLLQDVNRQLQASRDDLQHQTGVLQSVLDSMSEGVCVGNEAGQLMLVNPMAERSLASA